MKLSYINSLGLVFFIEVNNLIFYYNYNIKLIHQFFVYYRSNLRIGCRAQKNRSNVNYSTRKLYKQKGTGKARAGMRSSPLRIGGGRAFPSGFYENFTHKFNKKMYKKSLCIIYYQLMKEDRLFLIDDFFLFKPSTKLLLDKLILMNLNFKLVILLLKIQKNFFLSSRNLFNINILNLFNINPILLIQFSKILIPKLSLYYFENILL